MVMLDDDAVDAGVQNDLDEEMWEDAGYSCKKRKTKSAELARYQEHQKSRKTEARDDCENDNDTDDNSDDDDAQEDHAVEDEEDAKARRLVETQARQRSIRSRRIVMSDSESEG